MSASAAARPRSRPRLGPEVGALPPGFERAHPRVPTSIRALVQHKSRFQTALIRNVSHGGVGLVGTLSAHAGDDIEIQLLSGRQYKGKIRWWCNGHCGIALREALADDDPLLRLARSRPRSS
jgi:hypothetical protein